MDGPAFWLVPAIGTLGQIEGEALTAAISTAVADGHQQVVLDLEAVDLMTSPAIGAIIVMHKRLTLAGGILILTNLSSMLRETLAFLKLDQVLTVCHSAEEVKRSLRPT